MGTTFDYFEPKAGTRYFEDKIELGEELSGLELAALKNRRLLYHLLNDVGFTNYREEWWHFDYGDQFWGKLSGDAAVYGPKNEAVIRE